MFCVAVYVSRQNMKVFTCTAPYPVDVFVRLSLRERGWVEKFGPRMLCLASPGQTTDRALECNTDEGNMPCHLMILFFSFKFIILVNSLFLSIKGFFVISILFWMSLWQYPSSDIILPRYLNCFTFSNIILSICTNFHFRLSVSADAHHFYLFHIDLHTLSKRVSS